MTRLDASESGSRRQFFFPPEDLDLLTRDCDPVFISREEQMAAWDRHLEALWKRFAPPGGSPSVGILCRSIRDSLRRGGRDLWLRDKASFLEWAFLEAQLGHTRAAQGLLRNAAKQARRRDPATADGFRAASLALAMFEEDGSCRAYYWAVHGFDPLRDLEAADAEVFRYVAEYPLLNDPHLVPAGVAIQAVVCASREALANLLVFRCGEKSAAVYCTHTVVTEGAPDWALRVARDVILQEGLAGARALPSLPPWEHFVALRSYAAAIADVGVEAMLVGAYSATGDAAPGEALALPFGFNAAMQQQVIAALRGVALAATRSIAQAAFLRLCETCPPEWVGERLPLLDKVLDLKDAFFTDRAAFESVAGTLAGAKWTWDALADYVPADAGVAEIITTKARDLLWAAAQGAIERRDPHYAYKLLNLLARGAPRDIEVCHRLGDVAMLCGKWNEVLPIITPVAELNEDAGLWALVGHLNYMVPDVAEGIRAMEHAVRLDPDNVDYFDLLGQFYENGAQWAKAVECFERVVTFRPDLSFVWFKLQKLHERLGNAQGAKVAEQKFISTTLNPAAPCPPSENEIAFQEGKEFRFPSRRDYRGEMVLGIPFILMMISVVPGIRELPFIQSFYYDGFFAGTLGAYLICLVYWFIRCRRLCLVVSPSGISFRLFKRFRAVPWSRRLFDGVEVKPVPVRKGRSYRFDLYVGQNFIRRFNAEDYQLYGLNAQEFRRQEEVYPEVAALRFLVLSYQRSYINSQ